MTEIFEITGPLADDNGAAIKALENGALVLLPQPDFSLSPAERQLIAAGAAAGTAAGAAANAAKNISYDPSANDIKGADITGENREILKTLMARYAAFARSLVLAIAPTYAAGLKPGRTSFRPTEIAGRETSWRKDDKRRHVDAFPSTPTHGARILRVFMNVDQAGTPRHWRVGPDFESYAKNFLPHISRLPPGAATLLALTRITKSRRTAYDQTMLGLHDAAKRDTAWQTTAPARDITFPPGQAWLVFTDQTPHAALAGRNALEQSFYISPNVLLTPAQAPLAILSRLTGRDLSKPLL